MTLPANAPQVVDLPRFALIMAHLRRAPPGRRAEVLARLGLDERAWESAVATWAAARDAELSRGASDLTRRFGVAFGRAQKQLDRLGPDAPPPVEPPPPPIAEPPRAVPAPVAAPPIVAQPAMAAPPPMVPPPPAFVPPAAGPPVKRPQVTLQLPTAVPAARLPFAPGDAGTALEAALAHARAVQGPAPVIAHGETVGLSGNPPAFGETVGVAAGAGDVRPPPGVPDLTLPQYASLRVELQQRPAESEAILGRYGVAQGGRPALDAFWRRRFEADPLLRMMFAKAYATYVAWLRENGRGG